MVKREEQLLQVRLKNIIRMRLEDSSREKEGREGGTMNNGEFFAHSFTSLLIPQSMP